MSDNSLLHNLPEDLGILQTSRYALAGDKERAAILKDLKTKFADKSEILSYIDGFTDEASARQELLRQQLKRERNA